MNSFFAPIYETWFGIYNSDYAIIFNHLYNFGGYVTFGLSFLIIPLILWVIFYYLWKNPYGQFWHWLIWLIVTFLLVVGFTYGFSNSEIFSSTDQSLNDALADPSTGYQDFALTLPLKYSLVNGLLAVFMSFIYSLFFKQFSKLHIHLPI